MYRDYIDPTFAPDTLIIWAVFFKLYNQNGRFQISPFADIYMHNMICTSAAFQHFLFLPLSIMRLYYSHFLYPRCPCKCRASDASPGGCSPGGCVKLLLSILNEAHMLFISLDVPLSNNCMQSTRSESVFQNIIHVILNPLLPTATYMLCWIGLALVQVMAYRLFGAKPK